jgi:predicted nucleotidyltransferase
MLDDALLARLIAEYDTQQVTGFALAGSHARGDATRYSDVDLLRFVSAEADTQPFIQRYVDGHLLSVTTYSVGRKRADLRLPEAAVWVVPTLRRMRILMDKRGEMAELQREAEMFEWARVQADAEKQLSADFVGWAEEVHKILSGLVRRDESALAYGTLSLVLGMVRIMALARGVLIVSENTYFREVGEAVGVDSDWMRYLERTLGVGSASTVDMRANAALALYRETVRLIEPIITPLLPSESLDVVQSCAALLDDHIRGGEISS